MPAKITVPANAKNARTRSTSPGAYLLERVKALADDAQIADPVTASAIIHLPFALKTYDVIETTSCARFPSGRNFISANYDMADGGWFHALPTGKRLLFTSPIYDKNGVKIVGRQTFSLDDPSFSYAHVIQSSCAPHSETADFGITFANIPAYACISTRQIKAEFPEMHIPAGAEAAGLTPDFSYVSSHSWVQFFMATNPAAIQTAPRLAPHQPNCLTQIDIYALLDLAEEEQEYAQRTVAKPRGSSPPKNSIHFLNKL